MAFLDLSFHLDIPSSEEKNDPKNDKNQDRDFEYYREKIVALAGIIITFSTAIFAFLFNQNSITPNNTSLISAATASNITVKILFYIALVSLFASLIASLIAIYNIIEGYKSQGRYRLNPTGDPEHNTFFGRADFNILWALRFFGTGISLSFVIFSVQYFIS